VTGAGGPAAARFEADPYGGARQRERRQQRVGRPPLRKGSGARIVSLVVNSTKALCGWADRARVAGA
jgi:hypothetical protein